MYLDFIKNIAVDKVFLAPNALSAMDGATTSNEEMRAMKQAMMASSTESYMLCDSSKIGKRAFCKFADPSEFQMMFTDSGISQKEKEALEKRAQGPCQEEGLGTAAEATQAGTIPP